jgi:SAM-dependent methyltransferase
MLHNGRPKRLFESKLRLTIAAAKRVLDVGTSRRFAKELSPYEGWFEGIEYIAAGFNPDLGHGKYNCDCHQDVEAMTFPDGYFDAVICLEVLEHVADPFRAARELQRVCRPGGRLFVTVPFLTGYHGKGGGSQSHDAYPDYWRFTHEGLGRLFSGLKDMEVLPLDGPLEFRVKAMKGDALLRLPLARWLLDRLDKPRPGKTTTRHLMIGSR